jgi:transcription antitermination protein NusB
MTESERLIEGSIDYLIGAFFGHKVKSGGKQMTRREAREQALCLIFEGLFTDEPLPDIIELAKEARELDPDPFAHELAAGVFAHIAEIDKKIEKYSIGWSNTRISKVVLSVLRMSVYEIDYLENIPVSVTINEAVELAKKYGGDGDPGFINGVLGSMVRAEKAEEQ